VPSPPDTEPRLRIEGLTKAFGRTRVLEAIDLAVAPGEAVLLAGSNGSGKTTLLRCVAGLARHGGRIRLDGRPCGRRPGSRADLGYLPQTPGLPTWATGAELLHLFGRLRGAPEPAVALPEGFLPPLGRPVGELSGGQRQRIAIVVALLGAPRLLLLDEPAANLDEEGRHGLGQVLTAVRADGTSVLIAAPSPADLGGLADRTVRLVDGHVVGAPHLRAAPRASGPASASAIVAGSRTTSGAIREVVG
jgi:ABC-type multidrug transport system ATPase subunit